MAWMVERVSGNGAPVYSIAVDEMPLTRTGMRSTEKLHTAVHSISYLISGPDAIPVDDVLAAIQLALEMDGTGKAKLSYHEATGLVFARVNTGQSAVINTTVTYLEQHLRARRTSEKQAPLEQALAFVGAKDVDELVDKVLQADHLRQTIHELRRHVTALETRVDDLTAELADARREGGQ